MYKNQEDKNYTSHITQPTEIDPQYEVFSSSSNVYCMVSWQRLNINFITIYIILLKILKYILYLRKNVLLVTVLAAYIFIWLNNKLIV